MNATMPSLERVRKLLDEADMDLELYKVLDAMYNALEIVAVMGSGAFRMFDPNEFMKAKDSEEPGKILKVDPKDKVSKGQYL